MANQPEPIVDAKSIDTFFEKETKKLLGFENFPFRKKLSFVPLIQYWKKRVASDDLGIANLAKSIVKELDNALEFQAPIEDMSLLKEKKPFVDLLMSALFPPGIRETQLARASLPFNMEGFYHTPKLKELMRSGNLQFCIDKSPAMVIAGTIVKACALILNKFYGQNIRVKEPFIFTVFSDSGMVEKHYKSELNIEFVDIKKLKPLKAISQEQINSLLSNIYDLDTWLEYIPPANFEFQGMVIVNLIDITEEETLSRLKHALLDRDAIVSPENIQKLEEHLRPYFHIHDLRLGVTAIDYPIENMVAHKYKIRHYFLADRYSNLLDPKFKGSIYETACKLGEVFTIEDINHISPPTLLEKGLLEEGIQSIAIAPLKNQNNQVVGLLEVGAKKPYQLNSLTVLKLQEITPLFRTALERSRDEIDNQIEVIIREEYTALHSSVEWKFIEAAFELLQKREEKGSNAKIKNIVFEDVYPLYGQADIVRSSTIRNEAIQADLIDNLQQALKVLETANKKMQFPIIDHYILKVNTEISKLKVGINSNDEYRILEFIKREIHSLFDQIQKKDREMEPFIKTYYDYLDPTLLSVYRKRKDYEDSVAIINDVISDYLEQQEIESQEILPHYFEKYKTDGVEYDIYTGQSLLKNEEFNFIYLKNLRLWQLIAMCEITKIVAEQTPQLPVPLTTAQLILVHSTPLSIRFRMDEKQFDVDGAYNIRYAIIKKRIDKAYIKGTDERLTVSGKVAIVYGDEQDRSEYLEYIEYLKSRDLITDDIEDLVLENMQGVQGLKALRITVKIPEQLKPLSNGQKKKHTKTTRKVNS